MAGATDANLERTNALLIMRITVSADVAVFDATTDAPITDAALLDALPEVNFPDSACAQYLDSDLSDLGLVGGETSLARQGNEPRMQMIFWAPSPLAPAQLERLTEYAIGQWEDGIGEGGFEAEANGHVFLVAFDGDRSRVRHEQHDDGRPVAPPPELASAARDGRLSDVLRLLAEGASPDQIVQATPALTLSILFGHVDVARALIEHGASANATDQLGHTALHACALSRSLSDEASTELASRLLEHGADPGVIGDDETTAADYAAVRGKTRLKRLLR